MAVYKVMCTSLDARSDGFFLFGIEQSYPEIKCLKNVDKLKKCACGQLVFKNILIVLYTHVHVPR